MARVGAGTSARRQAGMRHEQRLTKRRDFAVVYRKGRAFAHPLVVLRLLPNQLPYSRYGFTVSKTVGKAVVRNRVRRRLREGIRTLAVEPGWDIVVIARQKAAAADFHTLRQVTADLLSRAELLTSASSAGQTGPTEVGTIKE